MASAPPFIAESAAENGEVVVARRTRRQELAPVGILGALAVVFLLNASPWLGSGFGESHDGRNAAVWGLASRALREDPIKNHLGGDLGPGYRYADHPPLIIG